MTRVTVDDGKLRQAYLLIAGRVWYSLDHGLPLDGLDAERVRQAFVLLEGMMEDAKEVK